MTLSFALVVAFAIALYQPEKPSVPPSGPIDPTVEAREPPARTPDLVPSVTPVVPSSELAARPASVPSFRLAQSVEQHPEDGTKPRAPSRTAPEKSVKTSGGGIKPRVPPDRKSDALTETSNVVPVTHRQAMKR